jgi:hypothetical protein
MPVMREVESSKAGASRPVSPMEPTVPPIPAAPASTSYSTAGTGTVGSAGPVEREGPSLVGRFFRFIFGIVAAGLLLGAMGGALTLAFDLPGVMAAGGFGARAARDMARAFDTPAWPPILRAIIALGMFVVALGSATILLMLRRSRGGLHMLRAAAGIFLVLWAPFVLFSGVPEPRAMGPMPSSGWVVIQEYVKSIQPQYALRAGVVVVAGVMLLVWPAKARRKGKFGSSLSRSTGSEQAAANPA